MFEQYLVSITDERQLESELAGGGCAATFAFE